MLQRDKQDFHNTICGYYSKERVSTQYPLPDYARPLVTDPLLRRLVLVADDCRLRKLLRCRGFVQAVPPRPERDVDNDGDEERERVEPVEVGLVSSEVALEALGELGRAVEGADLTFCDARGSASQRVG